MFNLFQKKSADATSMKLKVEGMHCTSCSMNIDGALEELPGVKSASTHYASATTTVEYDPEKVSEKQIQQVIKDLGYKPSADK